MGYPSDNATFALPGAAPYSITNGGNAAFASNLTVSDGDHVRFGGMTLKIGAQLMVNDNANVTLSPSANLNSNYGSGSGCATVTVDHATLYLDDPVSVSQLTVQNGGKLDLEGTTKVHQASFGVGTADLGIQGNLSSTFTQTNGQDPTITGFTSGDVLARLGENISFLSTAYTGASNDTVVTEHTAAGVLDTFTLAGNFTAADFKLTHTATPDYSGPQTQITYGGTQQQLAAHVAPILPAHA